MELCSSVEVKEIGGGTSTYDRCVSADTHVCSKVLMEGAVARSELPELCPCRSVEDIGGAVVFASFVCMPCPDDGE